MLWQGRNRGELPNQTDTLHSIISTPIIEGDNLYGVGSYGELRGLDATNGDRLWESARMTKQERWSTAHFVRHEDRYFVTTDDGQLVIARFSAEGYEEVDRTLLLGPTTQTQGGSTGRWGDRAVLWAHPAFANQHIVVRNDLELVRFSLADTDY